jgi:hypothetical protein
MCVTPKTNNRYGQRRCLEAWHINMSDHALNRDDGDYLPEEYICILLADDVIPWVFKKPWSHCNFRSSMMKTLYRLECWNVGSSEYNSTGLCTHLYTCTRVASENMIDIPGCSERINFKSVHALFVSKYQSIYCSLNIVFYNIAFVNSERWLAKSRVDITQCQHGKFSAACKHGNFSYPSGFWHCYIIKKI